MRIAIAQIDPVVGAFRENIRKIAECYERACQVQARLLLTPELSLCGYPPHDLLDRPEMVERNEAGLQELMELTRGRDCVLVVGHVARNSRSYGRALENVVSLLQDGREIHRQAKTLLPTYDVFDEARYFEPAEQCLVWEPGASLGETVGENTRIAFAVCEDLWGDEISGREAPLQREGGSRRLYRADPVESFEKQKPRLMVSISASPFEWGKRERRERLHSGIARRLECPLIYVNAVGATDEILFDGASFACDSAGVLQGRLRSFDAGFAVLDWDERTGSIGFVDLSVSSPREDTPSSEIDLLHRALVRGIRDYFSRNGCERAILGLSGGIDSAVVAALAVEALGAPNVLGVAMPSQYSSSHSLRDAEELARALRCRFLVRPIKFLFSQSNREIGEGRAQGLAPVAQENLQARLRGVILMTLSNDESAFVLTTGNKSELSTGYCTLYGDMCGALAPLGDLFKTRVYALAREINRTRGGVIPESSITKPPSAELRPGQVDQDTLPPYEVLDALLEGYLEKNLPIRDLESLYGAGFPGKSSHWVRETLRRLELNEFKRRQGAPVLKISPKAFGMGRRVPLSKSWDS